MTTPSDVMGPSEDPKEVTNNWFNHLCGDIKTVAESTLPAKKENKYTQHTVSQRTRNLFAKKRSLLDKDVVDKDTLR